MEERMRPHWSVTVAIPVDKHGAPAAMPDSIPAVVHAPTPTDERTDLPALVIATFPLDSARRRVVPGALTDELVAEVASTYGSLAASLAGPGALDLVPGPLGASELDAALTAAIVARLAAAPLVPTADGARLLPPDRGRSRHGPEIGDGSVGPCSGCRRDSGAVLVASRTFAPAGCS